MKRIFEKKDNRSIMSVLGRVKPRFSSEALSDAIAEVLKASGHSVYEKLEEIEEPTCKVYVAQSDLRYDSRLTLRQVRLRALPENQREYTSAKLRNRPKRLQSHHS
jgi:Flp pilus assembly protein CpaB